MNEKQVKLLRMSSLVLLVSALGFLIYAPYLGVKFLNEDFLDILWQNPKNFLQCFGSFAMPYGVYWRPVTQSINALTYYFHGFTPAIFHLQNIIFHLAGGLILFYFVYQISKNKIYAFAGAILFVTLPGHLISVAWLPGRTDLLLTFFLFLALLLIYLGQAKAKTLYFILAAASFLLAVWSKELAYAGAILPLVFILLKPGKKWIGISIKAVIIGFLIIGLSLLARRFIFGGTPFNSVNFADFTAVDLLKNFCIYPALLFFSPEYLEVLVFKLKSGSAEPYLLAIGISLFIALAIINFIKSTPESKKLFLSGIFVYLVLIAPALTELNRWNSYAASAGIAIALGSLATISKKWYNIAYICVISLIVIISSLYINSQGDDWVMASNKCNRILKTSQPLNFGAYKVIRIWGLPDKYNRINLLKSGNGEAFHYYAHTKSFDTDAPVRSEFYTNSTIAIENVSQEEKVIHLTNGRFMPWHTQSRSILVNEEFAGKFSGINYTINNRWQNGKFISELRLTNLHISRDTLDVCFAGKKFSELGLKD